MANMPYSFPDQKVQFRQNTTILPRSNVNSHTQTESARPDGGNKDSKDEQDIVAIPPGLVPNLTYHPPGFHQMA